MTPPKTRTVGSHRPKPPLVRLSRLSIPLAVGVLGALVLATADAPATTPGRNGQIAFRRYLGPDRTLGAIFVASPDGTAERRLTTPPSDGGDDFPDVAPDGRLVAFQRCRLTCGIYVVRSDGSGLRRVDHGCTGKRTPPACSDDVGPAISPDGKRIAFTRQFGEVRHGEIRHTGIYTMRLDGSRLRRVTLPPAFSAEDVEPQWSPDGRRVVFARHNITLRPKGKQALFIVNADGTGLRRVTPYALKAGDGPDWSPDGREILFRSPETEDFSNSNIWTIRPDGTHLRQVTHAAPGVKVYSASFSPDGTQITLGMTGVDQQADVFRIGVDGTGLTPVTRTPSWDSAPDWGIGS